MPDTGSPNPRAVFRQAHPWVTTACRLLLVGVFGYSGYHAMTHPTIFLVAVEGYQLVPGGLEQIVAYGLPIVELALAVLLLFGLGTRLAGVGVGVLLVVFIIGISQAWARGLAIDCGCFGGGGAIGEGQTHYLGTILRDVGLAIAAGWVAVLGPGRFALDTVLGGAGPDPLTDTESSP